MNFKTTYILFGALALMIGALGVTLYYQGGPKDKDTEGLLFPSAGSKDKDKRLTADDVTKVVVQRKKPAGSEVVFERDGKNWKITAPRALRAEGPRVNGMIDAILSARTDEQARPKNLKEGELDSPSRVITLHGKGRTLTLTIGAVDPGAETALAYVTSSEWGANKPLAVKKREIESALEEPGYFRAKELLGDNTDSIVTVKVSDPKKGTVELAKTGDRWRFIAPDYGDANVDSNFLNNLTDLKVEYRSDTDNDFVQDDVTDLAKVDPDLPKSDVLRIEVGRGEDPKKATKAAVSVYLSKKAGEKYYASTEEGKGKDVVKLSVKSVEPFVKLLEDPSSLRNKNLLALDPFKTPDAIDVRNSYGDLEFRHADAAKPWELYRGGSAVAVDEQEVRLLIDALNKSGQVVSFPDPKRKKELGLEKPDVTVWVWSDSLEKPDPKKPGKPGFKKGAKEKPVTVLRFGNREGPNVAVERVWGTDSSIVLVPGTVLDQVRKGPLGYYDKSVPGFATGIVPDTDVTKVELVRGGETTEVVREKPTSPWTITKPASLKGRTASEPVVREILTDVNRLPVREVVAEKADAGQLDREYGLAKPANRVIVTVTKDMKDTKHEYDFGKEVSGKGFYARVSGRDTIYLVEPRALDGLKKELRDTTVFTFDPDKVVTLKLTGWKNVLGAAETMTVEKKDGKWAVKEKAQFAVDETKVRPLLETLSRLQAEKFVPAGKGMTLAENALQIEVTTDDKKTYDLTVGAEDGLSFFAASGQLKGETFLVSKAQLDALKKGPASIAK